MFNLIEFIYCFSLERKKERKRKKEKRNLSKKRKRHINNNTLQIIISSSNNFKNIIGFSAGTYPNTLQQTTYNILGDITPNLTPVNSLIVQCSIINNYVASPSNILDCIPINNVSFGSNISCVPSYKNL